jgi:hypothetical protein
VEAVIEGETIVEAAPEPAPAAEELKRGVCGVSVLPDQAFCASCGAALKPVAEAAPVPVSAPAAAPAPAVTGPYIEIADSGAHIPLVDQPQILIGREDDVSGIYPEIDMTPHRGEEGGVSRQHAQLIHEGDAWFVIDLDSTNGTYLNGDEVTAKTRQPLNDGDRLGFGDVEATFHIG